MTTVERYFVLTNSDNSLSRRFRVALSGFGRPKEKKGTIETTIDGQIDASRGGIYQSFNWTIMVREEEPEIDYGNLLDLETFFDYNDPNGNPSDILTLVTHEGRTYSVLLVGVFDPIPVGIMIVGIDAWFYPQVRFQVLEEVTVS